MENHSTQWPGESDLTMVLDEHSLPVSNQSSDQLDLQQEVARLKQESQVAYSQMHRMALDVRTLRREVAQLSKQRSEANAAYFDALFHLARMAGFRKGGSLASIWRIGVISALLARAMGESDDYCDCLQLAAPLHDVGEIALPDSLLRSTPVSAAEREQMMGHCDFGYVMFGHSASPELQMAAEIALGHHECFDGKGYPGGLAGEEISRAAAIVSLVDDFERMTRSASEATPLSVEIIAAEMKSAAGTCHDPLLVEVFLVYAEKFLRLRGEIDENRIRVDPALAWMQKPPERASWRRFL